MFENSLETNFLAKLQLNFTLGLDKPARGSLFILSNRNYLKFYPSARTASARSLSNRSLHKAIIKPDGIQVFV
jgi:hypothetical protein